MILVVLLVIILLTPNILSSKGENLQIQSVEEITEGEFFAVSVLDPEDYESETPYLIEVIINFNGNKSDGWFEMNVPHGPAGPMKMKSIYSSKYLGACK